MSSRASTITVYITSSHVYALNMMSIISSDACHHSIQFSIGMYMDAVDSEHFCQITHHFNSANTNGRAKYHIHLHAISIVFLLFAG